MGLEVFLRLDGVCYHGRLSGFPVGGANLAVYVNILKSLYESQDLIYVPSNRQIIAGNVTENTSGGDDEKCAKRNTLVASLVRAHYAVFLRDGFVKVCHDRNLQ